MNGNVFKRAVSVLAAGMIAVSPISSFVIQITCFYTSGMKLFKKLIL
jgi:hypothetical protein